MIRKALVSVVHEDSTESEKRDLCSLMSHRLETAVRFYKINKRRDEASRAVLKLKEVRAKYAQKSKDEKKEGKKEGKKDAKVVASTSAGQKKSEASSTKTTADGGIDFHREKWSDNDARSIELTTKFIWSAKAQPRRPDIRKAFTEKLPRLWNRHDTLEWQNRCIEKVRTLWRKNSTSQRF